MHDEESSKMFRLPALDLNTRAHSQCFVESRRVGLLPEDELLAFEALGTMDSHSRHEHLRIASIHNGRLSVECNLNSALDHTEILLVVLTVAHVPFSIVTIAIRSSSFIMLTLCQCGAISRASSPVQYVSITHRLIESSGSASLTMMSILWPCKRLLFVHLAHPPPSPWHTDCHVRLFSSLKRRKTLNGSAWFTFPTMRDLRTLVELMVSCACACLESWEGGDSQRLTAPD